MTDLNLIESHLLKAVPDHGTRRFRRVSLALKLYADTILDLREMSRRHPPW